jgi:hypothetical protein
MERVTGIEPALSAWEAEVLPLNYTRALPRQHDDVTRRIRWALPRNKLTGMPDERAASEAARRKKAADRRGTTPPAARTSPPARTPPPAQPAPPVRKPLWLRIVGWVAYAIAVALFVVFVVLWIRGDISRGQQLYPLPGFATGFLIVGIWTALGPRLYRSHSTATRAGKYVAAVVVTVIIYPAFVTAVATVAEYIVSLVPGSPLH